MIMYGAKQITADIMLALHSTAISNFRLRLFYIDAD